MSRERKERPAMINESDMEILYLKINGAKGRGYEHGSLDFSVSLCAPLWLPMRLSLHIWDSGRLRLSVQVVDLLAVAFFNYPTTEFQAGRQCAVLNSEFVGH